METTVCVIALAVALGLFLTSSSLAVLQEVQKGIFVEDFEDASVDQFETKKSASTPEKSEIISEEGNSVLHVKGKVHSEVSHKDSAFKDFTLEVGVKKTGGSYAGVSLREGYQVFFQMKGFIQIINRSNQTLFKSAKAFGAVKNEYQRLKVVCAGPILHVYVNGEHVIKMTGIESVEAPVAFYAHNADAYFDDLKIDTHVDPGEYLAVEPQSSDDSLVFPPEGNVKLQFNLGNYSDSQQRVSVAVSVKTWNGEVVKEEMKREISAGTGGDNPVEFNVGRIPAGFYKIELQAHCAGKEIASYDDLPLAIQKRGSGDFKAPTIPLALYYKYFSKKNPIYQNTYAHAAAQNLKDHHFNAVVEDPSFTRKMVDIFQSYGIATIARGRFLDHPGVIATLAADEPKPEDMDKLKKHYEDLRQKTDKPITTCLVGDALGLGKEGGPLWIWKQLNPDLRAFRWYGIKKSYYGILHNVKYKPYLPFSSVLRIANSSSDTPWWIILPSFGKSTHEAYFQNPTPAQMKSMMHMAMAYGADGILFWSFQTHGSWPCLVGQKSLEPVDGKYAAAAEAADKIKAHAELIKSLEPAGGDIRCPSPYVDAVGQIDKDRNPYMYAVNKNTKETVSTRLLMWAERWVLNGVRDVYSGKDLEIERDEEGYWSVPITLAPGEGQLLAIDVTDRQN